MAFALDADQRAVQDRVDFRIVKLPVFDPELGTSRRDAELDQRLEELTTYFSVFSFNVPRTEIAVVGSIEDALASSTRDFCLIQNAGHLFFSHGGLAKDLRAALTDCAFVTGHVRDRGGYFYLDEQCLLVNRSAWERLGRPRFGTPHAGTHPVAVPRFAPLAPGEPGDLAPSAQAPLTVTARFGYGWQAISESLAAGIAVRQWPAATARWAVPCGAYRSDIAAWREALLDSEVRPRPDAAPGLAAYLDALCGRIRTEAGDRPVFVFNSETDVDIPVVGMKPGVDTALVLAAGFKANRILETVGFHPGTRVTFYDYSAPALALKKMTVAEWDGADFGAFFAAVRPRLEAMFDGRLKYMQGEALATLDTLNREFQAEMRTVFASREHWLDHWRRFRALAHDYVQIDLLAEPQRAGEMIAGQVAGHAVMWVSDMFNAPYAVSMFSWPRRLAAFGALVKALRAGTEGYLLLGAPPALWQAA